jgi:hypothetical protein
MKSIRIYLAILSIFLIPFDCFAQTKRAKIGEITFHKLSEFYGIVIDKKIASISIDNFNRIQNLAQVQIEVKENGNNLIQVLFTDNDGKFRLKLEYDKYYVVSFSKQGYYSRSIRIYTYQVPDSLREIQFGDFTDLRMWNNTLELCEVVSNESQNPFKDDFGVYMYKPIEILNEVDVENYLFRYGLKNKTSKDTLYRTGGGIISDQSYFKTIKDNEERIKSRLLVEYGDRTKKS